MLLFAMIQDVGDWSAYAADLEGRAPELGKLEVAPSNREAFFALMAGEGVYGSFCGFAGTHPQQRLQMERLESGSEWQALRFVLVLGPAVSRLYAAEALLRHQPEKDPLDAAVRAAIQKLISEPQPVDVCRGCEYEKTNTAQVLQDKTLPIQQMWVIQQ
ncbi:MAG: hypothetical protein H6510_03420 [Acidobacteria bacterium]|nr:hypothetical protein [Acidobacteriota bacterium]